ncbi:DNA polymerase-3 subunit delta [Mobiluncus mulieris]|uniref:DNA-directed DNA polymerase n=1 Tax=Mobiluncus mulieris TaxID=2052 RepID=A0A8G2M6U7_9ACTO|nr:DNA polymerase III subunit delta [Mobiluncus mulieris]MBB5846742.1 DNA polymerase-3 subunit delta [Mobiluncus mulieris]STO16789.1 DNA polymerase III, delta subunit [Mobiluncus mulieris]
MAGSTKSYKSKTAGVGTGFPPWSRAVLAPVVLLLGKQEVFAKRAIAMLRREAMTLAESAGDFEPPEVTELDASSYEAGSLAQLLSPSLFGGKPLVVVSGLEGGSALLLDDLAAYLESLTGASGGAGGRGASGAAASRGASRDGDATAGGDPEAYLVLWHGGGVRGKKVLDLVKGLAGGAGGRGASGASVAAASRGASRDGGKGPWAAIYSCDDLKRRDEKLKFLTTEGTRLGRKLEPAAANALVDALGEEFGELVAVTDQLLETAGNMDCPLRLDDVQVYLKGRVETTGFDIADAAVVGDVSGALAKLRHALGIGVAPVVIVAAMAMKIRQLLQLAAPPSRLVQETGLLADVKPMNDWMARKIRPLLGRWDDARLGRALRAVSVADAQVKGGSRDAEYALEAMILEVCRCARK